MDDGERSTPARGLELRFGVTGHRALADEAAVERSVDSLLDRLGAADQEAHLVVVSSLAEGADRLVVRRLLARPRSRLRVVLPMQAADYERDFEGLQSRYEFRDLLARAFDIVVATRSPTDRVSAYLAARRVVIAGCDILLALWDQQPSDDPGGTAEVVAMARDAGRIVYVIPVRRAE